jgi:hypothetical protein
MRCAVQLYLLEGLGQGCTLKRSIAKDQVLTYDDVELPGGRLADKLRENGRSRPVGPVRLARSAVRSFSRPARPVPCARPGRRRPGTAPVAWPAASSRAPSSTRTGTPLSSPGAGHLAGGRPVLLGAGLSGEDVDLVPEPCLVALEGGKAAAALGGELVDGGQAARPTRPGARLPAANRAWH